MPRGVKGSGKVKTTKNIDEQLEENNALIENLKEKLASAKNKQKELLKIKDKSDLDDLQKLIQESGMSTSDIKSLIEKSK